jgi:hypothetical protein
MAENDWIDREERNKNMYEVPVSFRSLLQIQLFHHIALIRGKYYVTFGGQFHV